MIIVSFSFNAHDSSVSISTENRVLLVMEAERYFRIKRKKCTAKEMEELIV